MITIWKFPISIDDQQDVWMPSGARPVHFGIDPIGQLALWAIVDPDNKPVSHRFRMIGTGYPLPEPMAVNRYVGTVMQGPFVWHLFEETA